MNKIFYFFFLVIVNISYSQIAIGTSTPEASAELSLETTNKGLIIPRMTEAQMNVIGSPAEGLMLYCLDCYPAGLYIYDGGFKSLIKTRLIRDRNFEDANHKFYYTTVESRTGRVWLNVDLGSNYANSNHASFNPYQIPLSKTDVNAYGSLYQWGRYSDGHEFRNSQATAASSSTSTVTGINSTRFLTGSANWYSGANPNDLWNPVNNPCPNGFRVPTHAELVAETTLWHTSNSDGAYKDRLRWVVGGRRLANGTFANVDVGGRYWSSTPVVSNAKAQVLQFGSSINTTATLDRREGLSVRCIME